jgi:hypothetical protein
MKLPSGLVCGLIFASNVPFAAAEVFQCVDSEGAVLLTDAGCPPGYVVNLVVGEPRRPDDELAWLDEAEERAARAEAERQAAEAEAARLRAELETQRLRESMRHDRIDELDRKLDDLLDRPQVYGGAALVPVPALPFCGPGGRPWVDCRPPRAPGKPRIVRPDPRDRCGTFGCPPGITHAPWDRRDDGSGIGDRKRRDPGSFGPGFSDQRRRDAGNPGPGFSDHRRRERTELGPRMPDLKRRW